MKRSTVFTLIYLAAGICLTAIAFQRPDLAPYLKKTLLLNAGLLYLSAGLSTFGYWHQSLLNRQSKFRERPARKLIYWAVIAAMLFSLVFNVLTYHWTTHVIAQAVTDLTIVLLYAEVLLTRHKIKS